MAYTRLGEQTMEAMRQGRSAEPALGMVGRPLGRPPEDHLQRQREIYEAAGPLILAHGPRGLSMQQIARAAHVGVGSLYYYFPSKRDLVLCGLRTDILAHRCAAFHRWADHLRRSDPPGYLRAFVESSVDSVLFLRPAVYAAIELGSDVLWPSLETALAANTREFQDALRGALSTGESRVPGLARLGRTWRRFVFGAILDREAPRRELADGLLALVRGLAPPELLLHAGGVSPAPAASGPAGWGTSISPLGANRAAGGTRNPHLQRARSSVVRTG